MSGRKVSMHMFLFLLLLTSSKATLLCPSITLIWWILRFKVILFSWWHGFVFVFLCDFIYLMETKDGDSLILKLKLNDFNDIKTSIWLYSIMNACSVFYRNELRISKIIQIQLFWLIITCPWLWNMSRLVLFSVESVDFIWWLPEQRDPTNLNNSQG